MKRRTAWRLVGGVTLAVVLAIGFLGYTQPDLQLNWETLAAMCGL